MHRTLELELELELELFIISKYDHIQLRQKKGLAASRLDNSKNMFTEHGSSDGSALD